MSECEKWAKEKGCKEFASDCEIDNMRSFDFHMTMGFTEANQSNDILWCTWRIFFTTGKITYTEVFKFEEDESVKI